LIVGPTGFIDRDGDSSMNKRIITASLLYVSIWTLACNTAAPPRAIENPSPSQTSRTQKSVPMPDEREVASALNVEIEKFDGTTFKLADFRGKVLVIDFWASNCAPCVRMVPQLAKLSKRYRDQGVEVIGLTSDEKSDQEDVVKFLRKAGADYLIGYENRFLSAAFLKGTEDETGLPPIPQVFLLSREGQVIEHLIGDSPQRGVDYLEQVVMRNLNPR
jgi:thiol-disulfide isomerase/thioredoxin